VSELLQKFTEYAGFLPLEEVLTGEDGMVERSSKLSVCAVLHNNLFEVNDLEEKSVKFNIGVDVDDKNTVEGVDAATAVRERFDFLSPFPDKLSGD
jgi:hypothetical protein